MRALTIAALTALTVNPTLVQAQVDECVVLNTCKPKPAPRRTPAPRPIVRKQNAPAPSRNSSVTAESKSLAQAQQALDAISDSDWRSFDGIGFIRNYLQRASIPALMLLATKGDPRAETLLATAYHFGEGVDKDATKAVELLQSSATKGHAAARSLLGTFYYLGNGGLTEDKAEAARLFSLAADQGNSNAQSVLGLMYERGEGGLPVNNTEAVRLYRLAAASGFEWAKNQLTRLGVTP